MTSLGSGRSSAWGETAVARLQRITSYAEAAEIIPSGRFHVGSDWLAPFKPDTVVELNAEAHATRRRIQSSLFRREALQGFETAVLEQALTDHLAALATERGPDGLVHTDLGVATRDPLIALVSRMFGLDIDMSDRAALALLKDCIPIFGASAALRFKLGSVEEDLRSAAAAGERLRTSFFEPAWRRRSALVERHRRGELAREDLPNDLMTLLAVHDVPEPVVMREIVLFLHAGVDTTVMAVASSAHHLDGWVRRHPEDAGRLSDIPFLQSAAFEAVRLHPPAAAIRQAVEDVELSSGRRIRAGEEVVVDLKAVNCDPAVFGPDAEEFNLRRNLERGVRPYAFGFGGGPHVCPGKPMAVAHAVVKDNERDASIGTVARILARFYEAGLQLDPEDPPVSREGWLHERYATFPVVFAKL